MRLSHYARIAVRESRRSRGRILLFAACIAVGVAAIVLVAGLSAGINEGIRTEGRRLLAGDVSVEGQRPLPAELNDILRQFAGSGSPIERTDLREFVSIVAGGNGATQLSEIKVVEGEYPFYGKLILDPDRPLGEILNESTVVVGRELLSRLDINVGDEVRLGGASFRVAGTVIEEPDKLSVSFTLGPRVFLSAAGLARTSLLQFGSRVEYRALLKLPAGSTAADASRLEQQIREELPDASYYRVRSYTEAQPSLRRGFRRADRFLSLVSLLSLLIGGVGVAQVARAWLASRMNDIAVLRCLGATPGEVVVLFSAQVFAMALAGSILGAAAGTGLHWLLPQLLGGLIPVDLVRPWQPAAIFRGIGLGLAVAMVFTLPSLLGLRRVPPVRVFRREAEALPAGWWPHIVGALIVLVGVTLTAWAQADETEHAVLFTTGLVVTVGILALAAWAVTRLARLLPRDAGGLRLRHGLVSLSRPGASTLGAIVALGLGVTFVFATWVVQRHVTSQFLSELPGDAPSAFFIDIQPDQWPGIEQILLRHGATGIDSRPIVTGRFRDVDGYRVGVEDPAPDGRRRRGWEFTREQRLTYGSQLPRGNEILEGTFDPHGGRNGVSIEQRFADELGVGVGSTITLDVQGVPIPLTVTSIRSVDWRTLGINFFLFLEPGTLEDAPQMRVAVAHFPAEVADRIQAEVVAAFPNVTVIQIRQIMEKVVKVLRNLSLAIQGLGLFTVAAGVVVLGGTVAATQARRSREVALLKTLGMTRRDVTAVFGIEYALTGLVAAIIGIGAGGTLARAVLTRVMEIPWTTPVYEALVAAGVTITLAIAAGLMASTRALVARPIEVLRTE